MHADDVGALCEYPGCGQRDFLPVRCESCGRYFCKEHAPARGSNCCENGLDASVRARLKPPAVPIHVSSISEPPSAGADDRLAAVKSLSGVFHEIEERRAAALGKGPASTQASTVASREGTGPTLPATKALRASRPASSAAAAIAAAGTRSGKSVARSQAKMEANAALGCDGTPLTPDLEKKRDRARALLLSKRSRAASSTLRLVPESKRFVIRFRVWQPLRTAGTEGVPSSRGGGRVIGKSRRARAGASARSSRSSGAIAGAGAASGGAGASIREGEGEGCGPSGEVCVCFDAGWKVSRCQEWLLQHRCIALQGGVLGREDYHRLRMGALRGGADAVVRSSAGAGAGVGADKSTEQAAKFAFSDSTGKGAAAAPLETAAATHEGAIVLPQDSTLQQLNKAGAVFSGCSLDVWLHAAPES